MIRTFKNIISPALFLCCMTVVALSSMLASNGFSAQQSASQKFFASPDEALQTLISAVKAKDHQTLRAIFGPATKDLEPGDPVEQAAEFNHFSRELLERNELRNEGDARAILIIGDEKWPFPIPIVRKDSTWLFDTEAGRQEILTRRIGHNELLAIKVCRAYLDAQREYYTMPEQDGDQIPKYAQRMISSPGRRNGLYWPTAKGEKESPLGLLVASAKEEGYMGKRTAGEKGPRPFHGYYFRILKRQGPHAPGGKFNYVINNNMVAGHSLVAYPARWGASGIMAFIVNQRGRIYQKNLGPKTAEIARKMKAYDPDLSWKMVEQ